MRRRRTTDDDDGGSMDSLLDTMTNVVGILVIVLVVTQLGVGDAVERISQSIEVDPEELKSKQTRLEEIENKDVLLRAQLELLKPVEMDEDLLVKQIQDLRAKLEQDELLVKNLRQKNLADETRMAKAKEEEAKKKKREELEQQIKSSLSEIAKLRATLDDTPERELVAAKVIKLPDPRPAPQGLTPFTMICYQNRLYPLNFSEIQTAARARAEQIVRTKRVMKDGNIDPEKFMAEFSRKPFRNDFFDIEITNANGRPRLVLNPRERSGATGPTIARKNSKFYKDVQALDPAKTYLKFFVCGDSYEVYLTARAAVEENKLFAGWVPTPVNWKFAGDMGGPIRLGPPPPPPPPPDPNAPKPTPPKRPTDEID